MLSDTESFKHDVDAVATDSPGVAEPSFVEALASPASIFEHPDEVVRHPWFSDEEKRAILLSWARDELVIEQVASRAVPELKLRSRMDAVLASLDEVDPSAAAEYRSAIAAVRGGLTRRHRRLQSIN